MSLLSFIPGSYILPAGIAVALAGLCVMQTVRLEHAKTNLADTKAAWNADKAQAATAAQKAEADARLEEQRRNKAQQEIENETQQKVQSALSDAARARASSVQLQQRVTALIAANSKGPGNSPPVSISPSTDTTSDMLQRVFTGLDSAAAELGEFADKARLAGQACEQQYEALTPAAD